MGGDQTWSPNPWEYTSLAQWLITQRQIHSPWLKLGKQGNFRKASLLGTPAPALIQRLESLAGGSLKAQIRFLSQPRVLKESAGDGPAHPGPWSRQLLSRLFKC